MPRSPMAITTPDHARLQACAANLAAAGPSVTWIGHASALAQLGGLTLLTAPILCERASPLRGLPRRLA